MRTRNLAYIALLAGWICFCYWLYAERIAPRLHGNREKSWPEYVGELSFPLAFTWSSDVPLAGKSFGELKRAMMAVDSADQLVVVRGFFFRDEAADIEQLQKLAQRRIDSVLNYIRIDPKRILREVSVQEISADVRSNPFEAVRFELMPVADVMSITNDTIELCFPLKDSVLLPKICTDRFVAWINNPSDKKESMMHIVGTADGSGIAEPADIATDRAMVVKEIVLKAGWKEEQLQLSTGQRNLPLTLRNRCVVVYFE